jgi:predicted phage tail protein
MLPQSNLIRGAGGGGKGGGGGGQSAVEAPDSLHSKQYARVVDMVSEGEIGGLVDGLRSVFLDNTPIQNADGSLNFQGVSLDTRVGTQVQGYIPGFPSAESEQAVGLEIKAATPVIQTITDTTITSARVTVSVPTLTTQDTGNGNINGASVQLAIDVQSNGGGFVAQPVSKIWNSQSITGRFTAPAGSYGIGMRVTASASQACGVTFQIQYKTAAAGAWTTLQSDTLNVVRSVKHVYLAGKWKYVSGYNPVSRDYYTGTLPADTYMVQVVYISGLASIAASSAYWLAQTFTDTISGKTTSKYQRSYHLALAGTGPWDIRVRRLTADSTSVALQNKTFWDSYTQIVDHKLRYPNSALIALQIDAANFSAIPRRAYKIYGIKVQIPSNYDPIARSYTGVWNGTFVTAWSDNPAWCFYDMVTNSRYGLGNYLAAAQVDKWALYTIAQYCDELVDDGFGGVQEPRFTCNLYLQTAAEAYTVLGNMASIFNSILFWSAGLVTAMQDSPASPVAQFTAANVIDGLFSYSGSSRKARHTVAMVSWNDPLDQYKQKIEYVEDAAGIALHGVVQTQVVAMGCTSRGQAHRFGRALLYSERMETEVITFKCGLDSSYVTPGSVIQTLDPARAGKRFGGRIVSATVNLIGIDAPITIEAGKTYTLSCVLADGTLASSSVTNAAGSTSSLALSPALASAPQMQSVWVLAASDLVPEQWRVVSVMESAKNEITITALAHAATKFAAIEQGITLESPSTSSLSYAADPVSGLVVTESLYLAALGVVGVKAQVSWQSNAVQYRVSYRIANGNWIVFTTTQTSAELLNLYAGIYDFAVTAINALGIESSPVTLTQQIYGKTTAPVAIAGLSVTKVSGLALVSWNASPDLDVQVGGNIVIRHSIKTSNAAWEDGIILEAFSGMSVNGTVPLITGTYMAKALDSSGNYSTASASFMATEGLVTGFNLVATSTQHPAFAGAKTNIAVVDSLIKLDSTVLIDSLLTNIDSWGYLDSLSNIQASGSYAFDHYLDLATLATRRFQASITALSFEVNDLMDLRAANIDSWTSFDGNIVNECDVTLYAALTNDDPAGAPVWGPWTPFMVSDFSCRAAKFKLDFASADVLDNIQVSQLSLTVKTPVSP